MVARVPMRCSSRFLLNSLVHHRCVANQSGRVCEVMGRQLPSRYRLAVRTQKYGASLRAILKELSRKVTFIDPGRQVYCCIGFRPSRKFRFLLLLPIDSLGTQTTHRFFALSSLRFLKCAIIFISAKKHFTKL